MVSGCASTLTPRVPTNSSLATRAASRTNSAPSESSSMTPRTGPKYSVRSSAVRSCGSTMSTRAPFCPWRSASG
ncbi:Uncharacterised protein [Mycobacteroides abscessus subsp. abscessus]|nr:Uncharacterised protein [Mycobacteroides abscessus subsp. abscessus]